MAAARRAAHATLRRDAALARWQAALANWGGGAVGDSAITTVDGKVGIGKGKIEQVKQYAKMEEIKLIITQRIK